MDQGQRVNDQKIPILHVIDLASKLQEATVVSGEKSTDSIKALQRRWFRIFDILRQLTTDEGRGWANMAPGAVERRHQMLSRAVEIFLYDRGLNNK